MTFAEKKALYESKFISLDEALGMIHSGDTIAQAAYGNRASGDAAQPAHHC